MQDVTDLAQPAQRTAVQASFEDLGPTLAEVTFVVVDLETTGGSPSDCDITEIGAVKVRGGEVLGEFQTLVRPTTPIPAFITVLTGITNQMVVDAPRIAAALPAFLEFARGSVLVAHNARFDVGFLKAAAAGLGIAWPGFAVVDTVHLARQLVTRDESPNHKLASLARVFGATTQPDHRALHDARATVDVLHGLLARVGNLGVHTLDELTAYTSRVTTTQRRKRHLADGLPAGPGVYLFKDGQGRVLYVGTSRNVRTRVRQYFTASEQRTRMSQMVGLAESVTVVECTTVLEAEVRELRLIAEHQPRFNRRSRFPARVQWVKLTVEPYPRLSIVREVRPDGAAYAGPFTSKAAAVDAVAALHEAVPLRQCTGRLPVRPTGTACVLAELGRCLAPCTGAVTPEAYAAIADQALGMLAGDCTTVVGGLRERMRVLAADARYEDAAQVRDRLLALVRGAARAQRHTPLAETRELVAARRAVLGGGRSSSSATAGSPARRSPRAAPTRCRTSPA
ncbi:DNA polymerase III subunit epsilon [Arsenicicoccus piscis]|uniref:DNA polymerase III subunit epsilon n=1 Tax=Arsenicicoccus piscis TaxID=673954 RepID=A0ABQ6HN55_9MICO|nr:DNA polymerase III subunit epsilon [Arsenicicoccus piscis]